MATRTRPREQAPGHVGRSALRVEDDALLRGQGWFIDDLDPLPNAACAAIVRSPFAHARVGAIDAAAALALTVNGRSVVEEVDDRLLLSDFLRHALGLRGTHVGCEHGVCGACTGQLDGRAVRSCLLLAAQAEGCHVRTVESLADPEGPLSELQEAFRRHHALQCGFCTPGILMSASELLATGATPTRREIEELLSGHLCRCTGYEPIVDAIAEVAGSEA